jgi:type II secretory pathway pseudopilin PulG
VDRARDFRNRLPRRPRRRGAALVELLVTAVILSFVVAGTARLLRAGEAQQRVARSYSQGHTDLRAALRDATRAARRAKEVESPSDVTQCTLRVLPYATAVASTDGGTRFRFYRDAASSELRAQPEGGAAQTLMTGVEAVQFQYFTTQINAAGVQLVTTADPTNATLVRITARLVRGPVRHTAESDITLRSRMAGFIVGF